MARGQNKQFYRSIYAELKTPKNEKPYIQTARKEKIDYVLQPGETRNEKGYIIYHDRSVGGMVVNCKMDGYTLKEKNKWVDTVELTLRDHDEREDIIFRFKYTKLGRDLINGLLNMSGRDFDKVEFSVYQGTDGFNKVSVKCLKEGKMEWAGFKVKHEDTKGLIREFEGRGGEMEKDYTKVEEFFKNQVEQILMQMIKDFASIADTEIRKGEKTSSYEQREPMQNTSIEGGKHHNVNHLLPNNENPMENATSNAATNLFDTDAKSSNDLPF